MDRREINLAEQVLCEGLPNFAAQFRQSVLVTPRTSVRFSSGHDLYKAVIWLLVVFLCSWHYGCVPLQPLPIRCEGIIHSHGTVCHRNLVLDQLALLLFQVAEAQLGDRKDLGFEAALANQLAVDPYSCEIRSRWFETD